MKITRGVPRYFEWVVQNLPKGSVVGYDSNMVSAEAAKGRLEYFEKEGYEFKDPGYNLVNAIWEDRLPISSDKVFRHLDEFAGRSLKEKVQDVAQKVKEAGAKFLLVTALDEVAWLLNLRGNDITYNPCFFGFVVLEVGEENKVRLFTHEDKVENVREYLNENSVEVLGYDTISEFVKRISDKIAADLSQCNFGLYQLIQNPVSLASPVCSIKAIKNEREIRGFRESHIRDGAAVCMYFSWLKDQLHAGVELNECTAADELERLRSLQDHFMGLSFESISAVGSNGAIIHYKPKRETAKKLTLTESYLIDSGAQYLDGTIDTTRTVHFGTPDQRLKECYTRVLLGNLDLEKCVWPEASKITGGDLDILARRRLWEAGLDYNHGTGHGVGYFLNVHEGPQGISKFRPVVLEAGMNVTDEPGYYEENNFGIRIENVLVVKKTDLEGFLGFENVTTVPYDRNLIAKELLSVFEKDYIDAYHRKVFETLSPILEHKNEVRALEWLREATLPL